jgi:hypothetical protein
VPTARIAPRFSLAPDAPVVQSPAF